MATYAGVSPIGDPSTAPHGADTNSNHSGQVIFTGVTDEYSEERKKYLTAKYGQHQMKLIRKRLTVEDWTDKQLRKLYGVSEDDTYDCEVDLDDLLDLETDLDRRKFIQEKVSNCGQPQDVIDTFIDELLEKANTL